MIHSINDILNGELIPFAFTIGGAPAHIQKLRHRRVRADEGTTSVIHYDVYGYPLQLWLELRQGDKGRISWQLTMRAEREIHDLIEAVAPIDLPVPNGTALRTINGGGIFGDPDAERGHMKNAPKGWYKGPDYGIYPPREFGMTDHDLTEPIQLEELIEGRSSYKWLPIWFLHQAGSGLWFGPEWSGSWALHADAERCTMTLPRLRFRMHEGEEIVLPRISAGCYDGNVWDGCLHLRETIATCFTPKLNGEEALPQTVCHCLGGNIPDFDGDEKQSHCEKLAQLGIENLVFASCWYRNVQSFSHFPAEAGNACRNPDDERPNWTNWWETCGIYKPAKERFAEGYDKFLECLDENEIRLGLWYDPRVNSLLEEYNEAEDVLVPFRALQPGDRKWRMGLIDLGRREGRRYMLDLLDHFVDELGAGWVWHDLNVELCERYWDHAEAADRRGLMELRYMLGMQELYAEFLRRHPDVVIEWCASGGTMIDLGSLRFSHTFWISDCFCGPNEKANWSTDIGIAYRSRLNWIFPASLMLNTSSAGAPPDAAGRRLYDEHLITQCGGAFGLGQGVWDYGQADVDATRHAIEVYKQIRHLLNKQYNGLFKPCPSPAADQWDGWEYYDAETGEGVIMLFRLNQCESTSCVIEPVGLGAGATCEILLGDATLKRSDDRLQVEMPDARGVLIRYHKKQ